MLAGTLVLIRALDPDAEAAIVTVPLLLIGFGIGALSSQLGAVTVSAVPDELSGDVGGLQNTATNLGAAIGTALAGSILIAALTASFLQALPTTPISPHRSKTRQMFSSPTEFLSCPTRTYELRSIRPECHPT